HFHIEAEKCIAEIIAVFEHHTSASGALCGTGARDSGDLGLLERQPSSAAGGNANRVNVTIENKVELAPAGCRGGAGVVDNQMIDLCGVVRIRKIGIAKYHRIIRGVGLDEQTPLFLEIEAPGRTDRRAAAALNSQHRAGGD